MLLCRFRKKKREKKVDDNEWMELDNLRWIFLLAAKERKRKRET